VEIEHGCVKVGQQHMAHPVILSVAKDLKKVSMDAVECRGMWENEGV
jgi:hypothetical protein